MPKPDRAPKTPNPGFETTYTKHLKRRCRPNLEEINRIAKINNTNAFKAKLKINPISNVSTAHIPLTYHNTGISCSEQGGPLFEKTSERPSNELENLENLSNTTDNTIIGQEIALTLEETQSTIKDGGEKSEEQYYSSVESSDGENLEISDVDMEEPDTNQDTDKDPYSAKTDENSQTSEQEFSLTNANARNQNVDNFNSEYVSIPSAEGLKITILNSDIPQKLRQNIMRFDYTSGAEHSGDENLPPTLNQTEVETIVHPLPEQPEKLTLPDKRITLPQALTPKPSTSKVHVTEEKTEKLALPDNRTTLPQALTSKPTSSKAPATEEERTSPNSTFTFQRSKRSRRDNLNSIDQDKIESLPAESMDIQENTPPKISSNLRRVFKQKVTATLPNITLKNRYHVLTDESEEEESDDSIEKRKQNARKERRDSKKGGTETTNSSNKKEEVQAKRKNNMPPIVLEGVPEDHKGLTEALKDIIKGKFNVKYTNTSTIVFTEDRIDYDNVLANVKKEEMAYHTYTSKSDKSHAFVLRGLGDGTKIEDLEEDLMETYEIKIRAAYRMTTKSRPLFLVVTDPSITLDYLNRNVRVVLYTRITWELRRSTKQIIQCHNCQAWGHATSNCGRPSNCLKCAAGHHTRTCAKSRETPATCYNCGGDHPANFTKCKAYIDRVARLEERKQKTNNNTKKTYIPAPLPTKNRWESRREANSNSNYNTEFPLLPGNKADLPSSQQQSQENRNQPPRANSQPQGTQGGTGDFFALNHEMQELNSLVNIAELTRAVRELNSQLRECRSDASIFLTYNNFMNNLNTYKFRN
ncbi:unnamed protein product [Psylliodes chrysocephalus]|uniref:Gag-like protein n=1 Tax=Psylliodes chrysocephalus TaxID=3402493 RepID=A0A9P0CQX1_9CUCU|nr:unnamed protein product [Psylliodes chrysocephala]